jgi:tetratricopeptide (TPR) repeat protein
MSKIIELSRIQLNEMRKLSKKRNKPIASLEDAEETLRKIWYIHKQKEQKIKEILSYVNGAIASGLSSKDKAVAYYLRGILYYWQQRYADAEADLRKALNIDERLGDPTRCANAHVLLADICDLRQNIGEAIKLCQNGIVQLNTFSDVKSKQYAAEIFVIWLTYTYG